jgi:carboxylesterase type B
VLSEASKGLFHGALLMSGSALNYWATLTDPKPVALDLAKGLDCPTDSSKGLKACLKGKDWRDIVKHMLQTTNLEKDPLTRDVIFGPVVEPPSDHAFLTSAPEEIYASGNFHKVPLVVTVCEKEGLLLKAGFVKKTPGAMAKANEEWDTFASYQFVYDGVDVPEDTRKFVSKRLKRFYLNDKPLSNANFDGLVDLYSDNLFIYGVRNTALAHARAGASVWAVLLGYNRQVWSQIMNIGFDSPQAMTHADDLQYIFTDDKYPTFKANSEQENVSKGLVRVLAHFADKGDPNFTEHMYGWFPVSKEDADKGTLKWLNFKGAIPTLSAEPIHERMKLWDKIYKKLKSGKQPKDEL